MSLNLRSVASPAALSELGASLEHLLLSVSVFPLGFRHFIDASTCVPLVLCALSRVFSAKHMASVVSAHVLGLSRALERMQRVFTTARTCILLEHHVPLSFPRFCARVARFFRSLALCALDESFSGHTGGLCTRWGACWSYLNAFHVVRGRSCSLIALLARVFESFSIAGAG